MRSTSTCSKNIDRIDVDRHIDALPLFPHHHRFYGLAQRRALRRAQEDLVAPHALDARQRRWRGALDARAGQWADGVLEAAAAVERRLLDIGQFLAAEEDRDHRRDRRVVKRPPEFDLRG